MLDTEIHHGERDHPWSKLPQVSARSGLLFHKLIQQTAHVLEKKKGPNAARRLWTDSTQGPNVCDVLQSSAWEQVQCYVKKKGVSNNPINVNHDDF